MAEFRKTSPTEIATERPPDSWYKRAEKILASGKMSVRGIVERSTNHALLVAIEGDTSVAAIYKPARLARPLWDFDKDSLHKREVAAYALARAVGWSFVPPTVVREGPHGEGAVQLYVHPKKARHYFEFNDDRRYLVELMRLCVFDFVINNADRKAGYCFLDEKGRLWAIDHGTCFHRTYKLRTVIWDFQGCRIPEACSLTLRDWTGFWILVILAQKSRRH